MRTREFPVLGPDDESLVDALAVGLDRDTARVLAYLVARTEASSVEQAAASRLLIRVGTGLGRKRTMDALTALEEVGVVETTTIDRSASGRPPKGWRVAGDRGETRRRIRRQHADALVEHATDVAAGLGAPTGTGAPPESSRADTIDLALNWTTNGFQAPLLYAAERGLYQDVDLTVNFDAGEGSTTALDRLESGRADLALSGAATLCRRLEAGASVVPVALLYQRSMTVLYTTREAFGEPFERIEDLRGRRVAMPPGSETGTLARLLLSQAGVSADVEVREATGEERDLLAAGEADVVTGVAADPARLREAGHTVDAVAVSEHIPVPGQAVVAPAATVESTPSRVSRFLCGTMAGWSGAVREPRSAARAVAGWSQSSVDEEYRRFTIATDRFAESDAVRQHGWGWQAVEDWQRLVTALRQTDELLT